MAKKREEATEQAPQLDYADRVYNEVTKTYGKGICISGQDILDQPTQVIKFSPALDTVLSGGIPEGSWVSISGPPKVGKTLSALAFAANAQRPEFGGRFVYYLSIEGRLKKMNLLGTKGLKIDPDHFRVISSIEGRILCAKEWLETAVTILKTHPKCVLIIDSVSSLSEEREQTDGMGTETRGGGAKALSQFTRMVANIVPIQKSIVMGITHLIYNTSGKGPKFYERAGNGWLYQADVRLNAWKAEPWPEEGQPFGQIVQWTCQCSALGPPGRSCQSYLRYGMGIDRVYEAMEFGMTTSLIEKAGSWFTLSFMEKHLNLIPGANLWGDETIKRVKTQGGDKLYRLLIDNPSWLDALNQEITVA